MKATSDCVYCGCQKGEEHYTRCVQNDVTAPKDKESKPSWSIFPFEEADEVRKVFEYGASPEAYKAPFTYRKGKGVPEKDLWDATFRHLLEIQNGTDIDVKSGCFHWGHIAANALMAIAAIFRRSR